MTVGGVIAQARISRKTFYEIFEGCDECLLEALEQIVDHVAQCARDASATERAWVDRIRINLRTMLEFCDEQRALARLCVVDSLAAGPAAVARQRELLGQLAGAIDEGRGIARHEPPPLVAGSVVGGVFEVVHARLLEPDGAALLELLGPLMSFIVLPYLGAAAARRELDHPVVVSPGSPGSRQRASNPVKGLQMRLTYRTVTVLVAIAAQPGLSNAQVGARSGVTDAGQISKLLARLAALGLVENIGPGRRGVANAWRLTSRGEAVERATRHERLGSAVV